MYKPKATLVTPEESIRLEMQRPRAERILNLLRLIRLSNVVSEAGAKYRKSR